MGKATSLLLIWIVVAGAQVRLVARDRMGHRAPPHPLRILALQPLAPIHRYAFDGDVTHDSGNVLFSVVGRGRMLGLLFSVVSYASILGSA
jgi:hypothetical protein